MACAILISLYIRDELSFDRHHEKAERIFRVVTDRSARTPGPLAPLIQMQLPEAEQVARIRATVGAWLFAIQDRRFYERRVYWADQSLFDIFDVPLIRGDPTTALAAPNTIIISETMARKYFEDGDPIGQVIDADYDFLNFTITAVMEDPQDYVHFPPDFYISIATMEERASSVSPFSIYNWHNSNFYTYLLLSSGASPDAVAQKIRASLNEYLSPAIKAAIFADKLTLQPLTDLHLYSNLEHEMELNGDVSLIWMLTAVALFILLIACINFMNLATARSVTRALEIGIRKVVGAQRRQLIGQFLGEAIVFSATSFLLALGSVAVALPVFRAITGYSLAMPSTDFWTLASSVGIVLVVGIVAGSYPAFVLSAFAPTTIFKGGMRAGSSVLRKGLVMMQFTISIILIIGALVVYQQLEYIRTKPPGFEKEHVVVTPNIWGIDRDMLFNRYPQLPGVISITDVNYLPGRSAGRGRLPIFPIRRMDQPESKKLEVLKLSMWGDLVSTLGMTLAAGRNLDFEQDTRWESSSENMFPSPVACLLNEEAVQSMGWTSPLDALDQGVSLAGQELRVIGVVRDFQLKSLHEKIEPMVVMFDVGGIIAIRLAPGDPAGTLATLQEMWKASTPHIPFSYSFLDDDVDRLYRADETLARLIILFAFLAVLTACLGLFGLAALTTQQRTKEIVIRKVLGASIGQVLLLLSKEYTFLVLIANLIAWPVAYSLMSWWLQTFAYHTEISPALFPVTGLLALVIAWLTVSIQIIKSATANPVNSLRYA